MATELSGYNKAAPNEIIQRHPTREEWAKLNYQLTNWPYNRIDFRYFVEMEYIKDGDWWRAHPFIQQWRGIDLIAKFKIIELK